MGAGFGMGWYAEEDGFSGIKMQKGRKKSGLSA